MKLKTLEDIGEVTKSGAFVCNHQELKQEAIKWCKMGRDNLCEFMDLTEDDLKGGKIKDDNSK